MGVGLLTASAVKRLRPFSVRLMMNHYNMPVKSEAGSAGFAKDFHVCPP